MRQADGPSTGRQIGVSVALLVIDLMFVAWAVFAVGMEGWADSFESDGVPPGSPRVASQAAWLLGGSAVLTGCGLLQVQALCHVRPRTISAVFGQKASMRGPLLRKHLSRWGNICPH